MIWRVIEAIQRHKFSFNDEKTLQESIAEVLTSAGIPFEREHGFCTAVSSKGCVCECMSFASGGVTRPRIDAMDWPVYSMATGYGGPLEEEKSSSIVTLEAASNAFDPDYPLGSGLLCDDTLRFHQLGYIHLGGYGRNGRRRRRNRSIVHLERNHRPQVRAA